MNPCFTVDCKEALEALKERKFHRPNKSTVMFPNLDLVEKDLDTRLSNITHGIGVALRENDPLAIDYYCNSIIGYINRLSFRLPRQTLIDLIPLLIQAATLPNQKGDLVHTIFEALNVLLVKSRLTRADLTIPLKALFDLFQGIIYGKNAEVLYQNVFGTLVRMKRFYALEDVKELWNTRLLSLLSPLEHGFHWVDLCTTFLPTDMMREEHELFGSGLWFSTLWNLYSKCQMNVGWSKYLPELFYKLERDQPGLIDWRPYEEEIFTRILRALQMKGESSTYGLTTSLKHWAAWVAYRLGRNSCLSQLQRVLRYAEPLLHPSNDGPHTEVILLFLNELTHKVLARYRRERIKKHTKDLRPSEFHLDDLELHRFVVSILPVTLSAVFLEIDSEQNLPSDILKKLATFVPSLVLPKILELVYPSLKATCEPHRFNQSLRCLEEVILLLCQEKSEAHLSIVSNGFGNGEEDGVGSLTFTGESKETISVRSHVILILDELVDGIDINDLDKIIIVVQIMSHFFYLIPNVDASSLAENGDSLTHEESALCRLTARLPVIAEKAIEKIITIITILAAVPERNEEGCNGTESEEFGSDEKTLKKAIEKCVNALFVNAVKAVRLKMAHQILSFVHTNVIGASLAADLAQTLVQSAVFYVPEVADELVSFICQKVTSGLNDFTQSGKAKCDAALRWWANLFPCLVVTPWVSEENREKILLVVDDLLTQTDPALYQPATYTLSGFLVFSLQIQESGWMAVHAEIDKPLTEWIPVRHWGTLHSQKQMKVHWRAPGEAEIDFAQQIINKYFKGVVERLTSDESAKNEAIQLTLNGADLCTTFVKTLEMILARTSENDEEQTRLLLHIAQCATFATNSSVVFAGILFEQMETVNDLVNRVQCLVQREKRMPLALAHASLELDYIVYQYFLPNGPFTSVHLRVLRMLVQCSLSGYQEEDGAWMIAFPAHKEKRMSWARDHITIDSKKVIFSNQKKI
ncbi:unnamed protein product, partial [Mesorhabditis belari]|uniref:Proteasome activator Blm10 middle HEAT repeats region domain-containing protein n=1 Tax=Mesorhabditis belari TaxID=2138241 RepID=A0AAF3EHQ6_9BILA